MAFFAGLLAGMCAFLYNLLVTYFYKESEFYKIVFSPVVEELAKTSGAVLLDANLILTHSVFGVIEFFFDVYYNKSSVVTGIFAIVFHAIFGTVTLIVKFHTGYLTLGILSAISLHLTMNYIIYKKAR